MKSNRDTSIERDKVIEKYIQSGHLSTAKNLFEEYQGLTCKSGVKITKKRFDDLQKKKSSASKNGGFYSSSAGNRSKKIISHLKVGKTKDAEKMFSSVKGQMDKNGILIDDKRYKNKLHFYTKVMPHLDDKGFWTSGNDKGLNYFNRKGSECLPFTKDGINVEGNIRLDDEGYNYSGINEKGFNKDGIHTDTGEKFDQFGFNEVGMHKDTGTKSDQYGFNEKGIHSETGDVNDQEGFDKEGLHMSTNTRFNQLLFDRDGIHRTTRKNIDERGFDAKGLFVETNEFFDHYGFDINKNHINTASDHNAGGFDYKGVHKDTGEEYNKEGYNITGSYRKNDKGYDYKGYDDKGFNEIGEHKDTGKQYNQKGLTANGTKWYDPNTGMDIFGKYKNGETLDESIDQALNKIKDLSLEELIPDTILPLYTKIPYKELKTRTYKAFESLIDRKLNDETSIETVLNLHQTWSIDTTVQERDRINYYDGILQSLKNKGQSILRHHLNKHFASNQRNEADGLYLKYDKVISYPEFRDMKTNYIKKLLGKPDINEEKYDAMSSPHQYTFVKARAGTGKTTMLKYLSTLLMKGYGYTSDQLLLLAFNRSSAIQLNESIEELGNEGFDSSFTFHSLAVKILYQDGILGENQYEILANNKRKSDPELSHFVQEIFRDKFFLEERKEKLYIFFKNEIEESEVNKTDQTNQERYNQIRENFKSYVGLDNKRYKSKAEKRIADFLFEHIREKGSYRYEKLLASGSVTDDSGKKFRRRYKPDFTFITEELEKNGLLEKQEQDTTNNDTTVDGFADIGIDLSGGTIAQKHKYIVLECRMYNPEMDHNKSQSIQYLEEREWKLQKLKDKNIKLIEIFTSELDYYSRETSEILIKERMESAGIICKKLSFDECWEKLEQKHGRIIKLTNMIESFITKCKQNRMYPIDVDDKLSKESYPQSLEIFYQFANTIYKKYQQKLEDEKKKDFNDVVFEASEIIRKNSSLNVNSFTGKYRVGLSEIKVIMIDEYQDFSDLFYEIVNAIRDINPDVKIVMVGDDWQLINGFAGSKTVYTKDIEKYFPGVKTVRMLECRRCPKIVLKQSNRLMGSTDGEGANPMPDADQGRIDGFHIESCEIQRDWGNNMNDIGRKKFENDIIFYPIDTKQQKLGEDFKFLHLSKGFTAKFEYAQYVKQIMQIIDWKELIKSEESLLILNRVNSIKGVALEQFDRKKKSIYENNLRDHVIYLVFQEILKSDYEKYKSDVSKGGPEGLYKRIKEVFNKVNEKGLRKIEIMSIHSSKGLEADHVIILEVGSRKYPFLHPDSELDLLFGTTTEDIIEEEKRLFYVAMTRTKKNLYYISENSIEGNHGDSLVSSRGKGETGEDVKQSGTHSANEEFDDMPF